MRTPADRTLVFTFASHPTKDLAMRWQAKLTFPSGACAETLLPIELADGNGKPVAAGVFDFAGKRLKVREGHASITYADFIRGKHEPSLWLYREGFLPIPGGLTFL